jgi:hypothetical protein
MLLLAFYVFLRIGEITQNDQNEGKNHCLQLQDVKAVSDGFIIIFKSYKYLFSQNCLHLPENYATCNMKMEVHLD